LEDRLAPATVHDVAGVLLITSPRGALTVAPEATAGKVDVTDNGKTVTYSNVGTLISITGNNLNTPITFTGNTGFNGNLVLKSGNGSKTITVNTAATAITGGNVTLIEGPGNDTTNLAGTIGGNLVYTHTLGANTLVTTGAVTVGGNATLSGAATITQSSALTVGGSLSIVGQVSGGTPLAFTGTANLTANSLSVTGGGGSSSFSETGVLTVTNNMSVTNTLTTSGTLDLSAVGAASTIGGNLYYQGGAGVDTVKFGANLTVSGNATISTGEGADDLSGLNATWTVGGNLSITEGNGNEVAFTVGGTVNGNESITQGNGTNGQVISNSPPGGLLSYHGGNGTDSLNLQGAVGSTYDMFLVFGTGTNTLSLAPGGNAVTFSGTVIGTGGTNTLVQGANATLVDVTFINFP
jgi:hypothetical protein